MSSGRLFFPLVYEFCFCFMVATFLVVAASSALSVNQCPLRFPFGLMVASPHEPDGRQLFGNRHRKGVVRSTLMPKVMAVCRLLRSGRARDGPCLS